MVSLPMINTLLTSARIPVGSVVGWAFPLDPDDIIEPSYSSAKEIDYMPFLPDPRPPKKKPAKKSAMGKHRRH